jgi:predicted nucleic acid-binding protein
MRITIDASVFVAGMRPSEPHYAESRAFILEAQMAKVEVICPTLVLPECSAAIARRTGNPLLAAGLVAMIESWPDLQLLPLNLSRARRAATIGADHRLRGADSIYVAIAEEYATPLIAWDDEILKRGASVVVTMTPANWLVANPPSYA